MATPDPNAAAARWAQNLGGAGQKITEGIRAVQVAPGAAAARQKSVWAQNTAAAQDKWAANTSAVSLQEWQQAAIDKGVQRIGTGAAAAQGKMGNFFAQLFPYINNGLGSLPARGNIDANINRSVAWMRYMAQFKRR